jgi:FkbM family methyltransferase
MAKDRELQRSLSQAQQANIMELLPVKIRRAERIVICGSTPLDLKVMEIVAGLGKKVDYFTSFHNKAAFPPDQGIQTIAFTELAALPGKETLVCIAEPENISIISALAAMGFENYIDFTFLHYPAMFDARLLANHMSAIAAAWELLGDEESRETFLAVLAYRITADPLRLRVAKWPQYFHPFVQPRKKDVIIDGGAFIGDTALEFSRHVDGDCMIFSFEPGAENYQMMVGMIHEHGLGDVVIPVQMGLWSEPGVLAFDASLRDGSHIGGHGGSQIKVIDLSTFTQRVKVVPTLIKLDVEKAEAKVLKGAEDLIKKHLPRLQVCVYHLPADLWEIPLMLKRLSGKYRIFLAHHWLKDESNWNFCETVAYATAE